MLCPVFANSSNHPEPDSAIWLGRNVEFGWATNNVVIALMITWKRDHHVVVIGLLFQFCTHFLSITRKLFEICDVQHTTHQIHSPHVRKGVLPFGPTMHGSHMMALLPLAVAEQSEPRLCLL